MRPRTPTSVAFRKYEETSDDLAELMPMATSGLVVDLACGTGTTTQVILRDLPADGRVVAVDASKAMLETASQSIKDPRVTWIRSKAEELPDHVDQPVDLVLHAARLREEFPQIRVCFVGLSTDLETINAYAGRTPWHLESLTPTEQERLPSWIEEFSESVRLGCSRLGFPYVDLTGDYEAGVSIVMETLAGGLASR